MICKSTNTFNLYNLLYLCHRLLYTCVRYFFYTLFFFVWHLFILFVWRSMDIIFGLQTLVEPKRSLFNACLQEDWLPWTRQMTIVEFKGHRRAKKILKCIVHWVRVKWSEKALKHWPHNRVEIYYRFVSWTN